MYDLVIMFSRVAEMFQATQHVDPKARDPQAVELQTLTLRDPDESSECKYRGSGESNGPGLIRQYRQRFIGWRFGILNFAICASIVFLINLIVTIWGSIAHGGREGILNEGECGHIKSLNSGVHVLINVMSTILLSGSNYCMQCMSAPTRREIDKVHAARRWLDVGIPSFRNLRYISRRRLLLWLLLGGSSVPLHLL